MTVYAVMCALAGILAPGGTTDAAPSADVRIVGQGPGWIRLEYAPPAPVIQPIETSTGLWHVVTVEGCAAVDEPGAPMLPERLVRVGVPPEGAVEFRVLSVTAAPLEGVRVAPVPQPVRDDVADPVGKPEYTPSPAEYARSGPQPEPQAWLEAVTHFRWQRVAEVVLSPMTFDAARERCEVASRLVVEVHYVEPTAPLMGVVDPRDESLHANSLINAAESRPWRLRPPRTAARPVRQQREGTWVKLFIERDGIYRVTLEDLRAAGVEMDGLDPRNFGMYYWGGRELPRNTQAARPEALRPIPIAVTGEADGRFDAGDAVLFYAEAVNGWRYDPDARQHHYVLHPYTRRNIVWLHVGGLERGHRMAVLDGSPAAAPMVTSFTERLHEEEERFIKRSRETSGIEWFWERIEGSPRSFSFTAHRPLSDSPLRVRFRMDQFRKGFGFGLSFNDVRVEDLERRFPGEELYDDGREQWSGARVEAKVEAGLKPGLNLITVRPDAKAKLRMDWFEVEYTREMAVEGDELWFEGPSTTGTRTFGVADAPTGELWLLDVTDPFEIHRIVPATDVGGVEGALSFSAKAPDLTPRRYYLASPAAFRDVVGIERDIPSDLRNPGNAADYVIVAHRDFQRAAERLAGFRSVDRGDGQALSTLVAVVDDVFDEFAGGLPDPTAIRDFLRWTFFNWEVGPRYIVLMGDGNYDYKNNTGTSPGNWMPPFEQGEVSTDDYFTEFFRTYLPPSPPFPRPSLALSRIPVQTTEQAATVVDKIIAYESRPPVGPWKTRTVLVGDDEFVFNRRLDTVQYVRDSQAIARDFVPSSLDIQKLYLFEYDFNDVGKKPGAKRDFLKQFNRGALIINYIGHGNFDVLAHEEVFRTSTDIDLLANEGRLPVFATFSCSISHFDHPTKESMSEKLLRLPDAGIVAAVGGYRLSYNSANVRLNKNFFEQLFFAPNEPRRRIGDAFLAAKRGTASIWNVQRYGLFGDPAMRLALPERTIEVLLPDTLQALARVPLAGAMLGTDGAVDASFNGRALVEVRDSARLRKLQPRTAIRLEYDLPGAPLYRAEVDVTSGRFETSFIVPKDVTYGGSLAEALAYAWNDADDGFGVTRGTRIFGTDPNAILDKEGPEIILEFEGQAPLSSGDFITSESLLTVTLEDPSGINITGEIGHGIVLTIDGNEGQVHDLTELFVSDGDPTRGMIRFQLEELSEGEHEFAVKAWDTYNNSSWAHVVARVVAEGGLRLGRLLAYPSPMRDETTFTFELSRPADVDIRVYTLAGRLVGRITERASVGYNAFGWRPDDELATGVYIWKVTARADGSDRAEAFERLPVIR